MKTYTIIHDDMIRVRASIIGQQLTKAFNLGKLEFGYDFIR